jgi:anthranilate synthase/aminodeoxychorismate synthase-like glutamine amidotransferase
MILLIDNYDSFVYNLARYFRELGQETEVVRNDAISVEQIRQRRPRAVVLSPGPCTPAEAGVSVDVVRQLAGHIPILGVCLGHQAIAAALGARIVLAEEPVHGRTSIIHHLGTGLFSGIPDPLTATRYHSLVVDESTLPESLAVTARTADGSVMALAHQTEPIYGVQFHPESVMTESGHRLLSNFLDLAGVPANRQDRTEIHQSPADGRDFFQQPIVRDHPHPDALLTTRESV